MSHSFKRSPVYKDGSIHNARNKIKKYSKRQAAKKVRKWKGSFRKSNKYRKISESWDICDYRFYVNKPVDAVSEDLEWWKKYYRRK